MVAMQSCWSADSHYRGFQVTARNGCIKCCTIVMVENVNDGLPSGSEKLAWELLKHAVPLVTPVVGKMTSGPHL